MAVFRAQMSFRNVSYGEIIEIPDDELDQWARPIERGWLKRHAHPYAAFEAQPRPVPEPDAGVPLYRQEVSGDVIEGDGSGEPLEPVPDDEVDELDDAGRLDLEPDDDDG